MALILSDRNGRAWVYDGSRIDGSPSNSQTLPTGQNNATAGSTGTLSGAACGAGQSNSSNKNTGGTAVHLPPGISIRTQRRRFFNQGEKIRSRRTGEVFTVDKSEDGSDSFLHFTNEYGHSFIGLAEDYDLDDQQLAFDLTYGSSPSSPSTSVIEQRKRDGLCPRCGIKGHFDRSLSMICPTHGVYT